jgi:hypothetical protein
VRPCIAHVTDDMLIGINQIAWRRGAMIGSVDDDDLPGQPLLEGWLVERRPIVWSCPLDVETHMAAGRSIEMMKVLGGERLKGERSA